MKTEPSETMEKHRLKVLVIDDSLMMRTLITDILLSDPEIVAIETARSSKEALSKLSSFNPDCITLDLVMPGEDGLSTLKAIMEVAPTPVVILSAISRRDASITFECLAAGAVSFVTKPSGELSLDIETVKNEILENVKAAARISHKKIEVMAHAKPKHVKALKKTLDRIIVIGASTGGPQTLEEILTRLSDTLPCPILIVQHMPNSFFTESFAERLTRLCRFKIEVAGDGKILEADTCYLAPPGFCLNFHRSEDKGSPEGVIMTLSEKNEGLSPSIDAIMLAASEVYGKNTVGIILSGMGSDGTLGMKAIKAANGITFAQDENALIFGMPRAAIEAGVVDRILSPAEIVEAVLKLRECRSA